MVELLSQSIADLRALRDSWGSVRGGWRGARQDAEQLLAHRRLLVDTSAMTQIGAQVVMRTRLRLSGDVQTEILRAWLVAAPAEAVEETVREHFRSVAVAAGGWGAALGLQRIVTRMTIVVGSLGSAASTLWASLHSAPHEWLNIVLTHWWLLSGFALALLGGLARWALRLRLRAIFRRGLSAPSTAGSAAR
jgi:hypothetical protein